MWTELWQWLSSYRLLVIFTLGISSFIIPLWLSLKCDLGTKLSKGEVRKSIVIALTVMYIILLSLSFAGTSDMPATNVMHYNRTIVNSMSNTTISENSTIQTIPATVNIIQNFLYVYVVIIGFYFGSRLGERIKMLKELKNLKPLDILQKRYAMGEIDSDTFDTMKEKLAKQEERLNLYKRYAMEEIDSDTFDTMKEKLAKQEERLIPDKLLKAGEISDNQCKNLKEKLNHNNNERKH